MGNIQSIRTGKRKGLSDGSTKKQAIIYTTAWVKEARVLMEEADVDRETEVGFGDANLAFAKDLESFGVVVADLKRPSEKQVLWVWLSDKEKK